MNDITMSVDANNLLAEYYYNPGRSIPDLSEFENIPPPL